MRPHTTKRRRPWLALLLLFFFVLCVFSSYYFYHFQTVLVTESAGLFQARIFARGKLAAPAPPDEFRSLVRKHPHCYLNRNGRWHGQNDPGHPALLALGVLARVPWLVNPVLGVLTLVFLFKLARLLVDAKLGYIAVAAACLSPMYVLTFANHMNHAGATCFLTMALYFHVKGISDNSARSLGLAGLALGFAMLTRQYTAFLYALPMGCMLLAALFRKKVTFRTVACMGASIFACLLVLMLYNHLQNGSAFESGYVATDDLKIWPGFGERGFPVDGAYEVHTPRKALGFGLSYLAALNRNLFLTKLRVPALLILAAACFLARPLGAWRFLLLSFMALFVTGHAILWWRDSFYGGARYLSAGVPLVLLLMAGVGYRVAELIERRWTIPWKWVALASAPVAFLLIFDSLRAVELRRHNLHEPEVVAQARERGLTNAVVFMDDYNYSTVYLHENGPFLDEAVVYARRGDSDQVRGFAKHLGRKSYFFEGPGQPLREASLDDDSE